MARALRKRNGVTTTESHDMTAARPGEAAMPATISAVVSSVQ